MIYLLLYRRVRLAKCQSLFIINLSISDVLVSILGVFRGLGIIDSRFVGAVNNAHTPYCTVYTLLINSFGLSSVIALLPLTIDRAVAVILPLQHGSIITHKTSAVMLLAVWLSVFIVLVNFLVVLKNGTTVAEYSGTFHRCILNGKSLHAEYMCLFVIPFLLILLMYGAMLFIIVKTKRSCGRFLLMALAIIGTNLLCFTPGVLLDIGISKMGYKETQVFYITLWFTNGVVNPIIYLAIHPNTREYVRRTAKILKAGR